MTPLPGVVSLSDMVWDGTPSPYAYVYLFFFCSTGTGAIVLINRRPQQALHYITSGKGGLYGQKITGRKLIEGKIHGSVIRSRIRVWF